MSARSDSYRRVQTWSCSFYYLSLSLEDVARLFALVGFYLHSYSRRYFAAITAITSPVARSIFFTDEAGPCEPKSLLSSVRLYSVADILLCFANPASPPILLLFFRL